MSRPPQVCSCTQFNVAHTCCLWFGVFVFIVVIVEIVVLFAENSFHHIGNNKMTRMPRIKLKGEQRCLLGKYNWLVQEDTEEEEEDDEKEDRHKRTTTNNRAVCSCQPHSLPSDCVGARRLLRETRLVVHAQLDCPLRTSCSSSLSSSSSSSSSARPLPRLPVPFTSIAASVHPLLFITFLVSVFAAEHVIGKCCALLLSFFSGTLLWFVYVSILIDQTWRNLVALSPPRYVSFHSLPFALNTFSCCCCCSKLAQAWTN